MRFLIAVKQVGRRKFPIIKKEFECSLPIRNLRDLISYIIKEEVNRYNRKAKGMEVLPYLTREEIEDKLVEGKVAFGKIYNSKEVSLDKALECVFLAYEDGLVRVLVGDREVKNLDAPLDLKEEDTIVFIRLTMLSGRLWI